MEKHTVPVSVHVGVEVARAFSFLSDLNHLSMWTLGTRVHEQIAANTWIGEVTASGQRIYMRVATLAHPEVPMLEWQCGKSMDHLSVVHRLCLLPASDGGVHVHWISFKRPDVETTLGQQGFDAIAHRAELLRLKAVLERDNGRTAPVVTPEHLLACSVFVDAPAALIAAYLADLGNAAHWAAQWEQVTRPEKRRLADESGSLKEGCFRDAYSRAFKASSSVNDHADLGQVVLMRTTGSVPGAACPWSPPLLQVFAVLPCAHVLGVPSAQGCVLHRIAPTRLTGAAHGDGIAAMRGESLGIKRRVEMLSGRSERFADGLSYTTALATAHA
ncbi:SRPBCC family protein [Aquabacterium sp. CECT 9606]|uniref:SRPBCC family protein n=1 Tax=Aquabacterium sp. CECT 9606 TaxID=2845822 RepID=UPI001E2D187B|nr:SRPBCC family protein [Aquabacterium sp. CECT 9606]CAH0354882.1 hypothetical protein AQB9606_04009 [Aquabacterium sp. CECT 9606]